MDNPTSPIKPKKKNNHIGLIILIFVGILLFSTNPTEFEFKQFIKEDLKSQSRAEKGLAGALMELLAGPTSSLIGTTVVREDYYICSKYTIEVMDDHYEYLGIFRHFYKIYQK
jgi:hypothetical protein